jgi:phage terminase large subunit-like protein
MGRYETHPHVEAGLKYCREILDGTIPACKWTKAACQRQLDDLARWNSPDAPYFFDYDEAERVCIFVELLPHIKGEWAKRREHIVLEPWQCFILTTVFGWRKTEDGARRFHTAYSEMARKNSKSTLLAAVALFMLAADGEAGAEVYSLATTRPQAGIVFRVGRQMALREPEFRAEYGVQVNAHNVTIADDEAKFEAQSSEDNTLDGLNVHFAAIDELHAHKTRGIWDVIETATGARRQPLVWAITTAGTNRAGICYEQRGYLCDILNTTLRAHDGLGYRVDGDAIEDESYFGVIYTIDEGDDWTTETAWRKANPNYGVSVNPEDLRRKCRKAMQRASAQPNFLTKHLDVWVNADSAWMDMLAWERCADRTMRPEDFIGWEAYLGLDLASKIDVTSMMLLLHRNGQYRLFGKHYLPEDAIDDSDNSQYRGWADDGHIIETEGNTTDYGVLEADLKEWATAFGVRHIGYDPGHGWDFCARMHKEGLPMFEYRPDVRLFSEPMKTLEELVLRAAKLEPNGERLNAETFKHDGNPAMSWMVSNVVCHRDAKSNIYPRKESEDKKIDGLVSTIIALGAKMMAPQPTAGLIEVW